MMVKSIVGSTSLLLVLGLTTSAAGQAADPRLDWHTLQTQHFAIHYHDPLEPLAKHVARAAERAHTLLSPALRHAPTQRTQVVLSDITDGANGSAGVIPYNAIRLFATAPDDLSPLSDHDDWMVSLVTHEYAHILHLDTVGGIPALLNTLTGKLFTPNSLWPRWFIEGLAVHEESKRTSGGRIRSSIFEMYLRMDALESRLPRIDQISNDVDRWPHGNIWYLYGGHFVRYIVDRFGEETLAKITHDAGAQVVPYSLNRSIKRATGETLYDLYEGFLSSLRSRSQAQRATIAKNGLRTGSQLTFHGEITRSPRFAADNSLLYWSYDGRSFGQIYRIADWQPRARQAARPRTAAVRSNGSGHVAPAPNGDDIIFATTDAYRDIYSFHDIFRWDPQEDSLQRLSYGLRAREPDVSPDGRNVVFTVNRNGHTTLWLADLADIEGTRQPLLRRSNFEQVYTPRWSPDGTKIALSTWSKGGYRDVQVYDLQKRTLHAVTRDRAMDTGPTWTPDGKSLLFSSDRTGIANIYRFDLRTHQLTQVTNVLGGAFQPAVSRDGKTLAYVGYGTFGFNIFSLTLDPNKEPPAQAYIDNRPDPVVPASVAMVDEGDYQPLHTLLPRNYTVEYTTDGFGPALVVATSGGDVVGFHGYNLQVGTGLEEGNVNARLGYVYRHSMLPLSVTLLRNEAPRGDLYAGGRFRTWKEESWGAEVGTAYNLPETFSSQRVSASYAVTYLKKAEPFGVELDPNDPPPTIPTLGWFTRLRLGWSYSDQNRTTYDISTSWGRSLSLSLNLAHPALGSDFRSVGLTWAFEQFIENPWVEYQVLAIRYAGGVGGGSIGQRPVYAIGGYGDATVFDGLLNNVVLGGAALRGYAPGVRRGNQYHLLQLEYRFPIVRPQAGLGTLPFFVNRLWASVYADTGDAFSDDIDFTRWLMGVGFELFVEFTTGYTDLFRLRMGVARGLANEGLTQFYAHLGVPF